MRILIWLIGFAAALLALPTPATAQTACPNAGAVFEYQDKYDGVVYSYDKGWVRITSLGGMPDNLKRCYFRRADNQIVKLDRDAPVRHASAASRPTAVAAGNTAGAGGAIPTGVYECDAPQMIGGMVMPNPQTGPMFGVFGPGSYRDYNGGRGAFTFAGGILTMTSGPLRGTRYKRDGPTLFYPLNARGETGSIRCIRNTAKSLNGR